MAGLSRPVWSDRISRLKIRSRFTPCGTRAQYVTGCRCEECRQANNRYERFRSRLRRMGKGDPLVEAKRARTHLQELSQSGIGRRSVSEASGIGQSTISSIKNGRKLKIRRSTEKRILEVDIGAVADGGLVDARPTWDRIERLMREGFTKRQISTMLGYSGYLQFSRNSITARNHLKVKKLYVLLMKRGWRPEWWKAQPSGDERLLERKS